MEINIKLKDIRAVSIAMAEKDIRIHLCGVLVESDGKETRIVATDGHRLHAVRTVSDSDPSGKVKFIVPSDIVKTLCKIKDKYDIGVTLIAPDESNPFVSYKLPDGSTMQAKPLEGVFPDYRKVIPKEDYSDGDELVVKPEYYSEAYKALYLYSEGTKKEAMTQKMRVMEGGLHILTHEYNNSNFLAIVMPLRGAVLSDKPCDSWTV